MGVGGGRTCVLAHIEARQALLIFFPINFLFNMCPMPVQSLPAGCLTLWHRARVSQGAGQEVSKEEPPAPPVLQGLEMRVHTEPTSALLTGNPAFQGNEPPSYGESCQRPHRSRFGVLRCDSLMPSSPLPLMPTVSNFHLR